MKCMAEYTDPVRKQDYVFLSILRDFTIGSGNIPNLGTWVLINLNG